MWVLDGFNSVIHAVNLEMVKDCPYIRRRTFLSCMCTSSQSSLLCLSIQLFEILRRIRKFSRVHSNPNNLTRLEIFFQCVKLFKRRFFIFMTHKTYYQIACDSILLLGFLGTLQKTIDNSLMGNGSRYMCLNIEKDFCMLNTVSISLTEVLES